MGYCEQDPYGGWEYILTWGDLKRAGLSYLIPETEEDER